jgi:hypothetical protein
LVLDARWRRRPFAATFAIDDETGGTMRTIRPRLGGGSVWVALAFAVMACGGGTSSQGRDPTPDATDAVELDAQAESTADDAVADDEPEIGSVDVQVPTACLTGQVCAADTDCNQGERCNLTLVPPECQILYCANEAEACDPSHGDALCVPGLVCTGAPEPACCAPDCEARACGADGCGGACGACESGLACDADGRCGCAVTGDDVDCDAVDDDCDGETDEHFPSKPTACGSGACSQTGHTTCNGGIEGDSCVAGAPEDESCNGADDDCDGVTDECPNPQTYACSEGSCQALSALWVDPVSSLVWQRDVEGNLTWNAAKAYCDNSPAGLTGTGWRLPTISELRSLVRGCPATASGGECGVTDSCLGLSCWDTEDCNGCASLGGPTEGCY